MLQPPRGQGTRGRASSHCAVMGGRGGSEVQCWMPPARCSAHITHTLPMHRAAQLSPELSDLGPRPICGGSLPPCCYAALGWDAAPYPRGDAHGHGGKCRPALAAWSLLRGGSSSPLPAGGRRGSPPGGRGMNQPGGSSALSGCSLGAWTQTLQDRVPYHRTPGSITVPMPEHPQLASRTAQVTGKK